MPGKDGAYLLAQMARHEREKALVRARGRNFRLRQRQMFIQAKADVEALTAEVERLKKQLKLQEEITEKMREMLALQNVVIN